jgi:hypothetical protein
VRLVRQPYALRIRRRDQILAGSAGAGVEEPGAGDLQMARLGMDDRLAELTDQVVHEAAAQDEARHAGGDRGERQRRAPLVALDVA